jgi:HSP20 family molecular chaperone IbpA
MMHELEARMPMIDLEDKGDKYVMTVEVPGFKNDEIEIKVGKVLLRFRGAEKRIWTKS